MPSAGASADSAPCGMVWAAQGLAERGGGVWGSAFSSFSSGGSGSEGAAGSLRGHHEATVKAVLGSRH